MSEMSDYLEAEIRKHLFRTGSFTKPSALYLGLGTAGADTGVTEFSGGSYARAQLDPADANWANQTAGDGVTSNLAQINFPTPTGTWGLATHTGIFDAPSGGNLLFWTPITNKNINNGAPAPYLAVGDVVITFSGMSNYLKGELIKHIFRTGSFTKPSVLAVALYTSNPTDADSGSEVSGGSYARVQRDPLDANWSGASGTNGLTDNVAALTYPTPSGSWGTVSHWGIRDATSAGNLLLHGAITPSAQPIGATDPAPAFAAAALAITFA